MIKSKVSLEFIPYEALRGLPLREQVKYIIAKTKENKILVFDSKLTAEEEAKLISETMKNIGPKFSGIEISSLSKEDKRLGEAIKDWIFKILTGKNRGTSIIGPAKIIKQIKRNPESISIAMK
ncbi:Uncharacterised protein [Candidatus Tiddalikarchaeum anstoanum]|nr:Uncharacterised protein [Candidatus Tiddalikarchaeum anstoanum]